MSPYYLCMNFTLSWVTIKIKHSRERKEEEEGGGTEDHIKILGFLFVFYIRFVHFYSFTKTHNLN